MDLKKQLILYGAYDRYNYGDNLMPLVFARYIELHCPALTNEFDIVYASISQSDLSQYASPKTEPIEKVLKTAPSGSAIIVIGGEVLCASNLALLMHMQNNKLFHLLMRAGRKLLRRYLAVLASPFYGTKWEFPYIPDMQYLPQGVSLVFNTVGGEISGLSGAKKVQVLDSLNKAAYLSVRDKRTEANVSKEISNLHLYPDSVFLISDVIDDDFLKDKVRDTLINTCSCAFLCYQASPYKVKETPEQTASALKQIADARHEKVFLLPIGYASGHDDADYLKAVGDAFDGEVLFANDLNVWEIMYVIKHSKLFVGTSLHGVITAMAFNHPHFGLNPDITKVDSFLKDWSIAPFNKAMRLEEIVALAKQDLSAYTPALHDNSERLANLVKDNNQNIIDAIM
ncbi:polysaccharide pyruvyl transferase family protein [Ningiella sp. W23]|uniref:polysaccharide pyruvyl transferase family protein n=1 Tax=Ningiella sp. W23 TaxID=3023715 RepID=UPI0037571680